MMRKIVIYVMVVSFLIIHMPTQNACAGGSGGEPIISDSVGWGIVGVMVIFGMYYIYKQTEKPPAKEHQQETAESSFTFEAANSTMISPGEDLVITNCVYKQSEKLPAKQCHQEKARSCVTFKTASSRMISPHGDLIIASW